MTAKRLMSYDVVLTTYEVSLFWSGRDAYTDVDVQMIVSEWPEDEKAAAKKNVEPESDSDSGVVAEKKKPKPRAKTITTLFESEFYRIIL
jgi:hypothetical protein